MGVYHRDYMRPAFEGGPPRTGPRSWSVVTWLIVTNVAVFALQRMIFPGLFLVPEGNGELIRLGGLSWGELKAGRIWTLMTYMFLHGSLFHLAANLLILHFAGRGVLAMLGRRHFLMIYFGGGVVGAIAQVAVGLLIGKEDYLIGASAGVVATLIALAALIPEQIVYLLLFFVVPVRMKMKTVALVVVGMDLAMMAGELLGAFSLGIGNLAHLGGALFGWLYIRHGLPGSGRRTPYSEQGGRWLDRFGGRRVVDAEVTGEGGRRGEKGPWFEAVKPQPYVSESVDEILEKISEHGMQSLTDEERKILERSSEKLARLANRDS